jgi:hypothetical protein
MLPTLTRRSIRRGPNAKFQGAPTFLSFASFLAEKEINHGIAGRPRGSRVFVGQMGNGEFLSATFAHPTKKTTKGRLATLSWRKPRSQ